LNSCGADWPSSGSWFEGGGSGLLDPGRDGALGCFPADVLQSSYRLRVGRAPYAALKAYRAMVLLRVGRRRRSPVDRGVVGVCSLTRDLFVIFGLLEGLSALYSATCASRSFQRTTIRIKPSQNR
jgi:hypothetical protein